MVQVVFVHGVNTRADARHAARVALRDARFKDIAFEGAPCALRNPYWAAQAVEPRWGLACIPGAHQGQRVALGATDAPSAAAPADLLVSAAKQDFQAVLGSLAVATLPDDGDVSEEAAAFWTAAGRYAQMLPHPGWIQDIDTDAAFLQRLTSEIDAEGGRVGLRLGGPLIAAARKLARGGPDLLNGAAVGLVRRHLPMGSAFVGDALSYVRSGTAHAAIRTAVLADVAAAAADAAVRGEPLVLVGHSFGGVVLFDLLSDPDVVLRLEAEVGAPFVVDLLLSVGSQVALFEEFKLFTNSSESHHMGASKAPKPDNVRTWLNIYDHLDLLGYAAGPVFEGVQDLAVDTVAGIANAHTAYFDNPIFYTKLHARLGALGLLD